MAKNGSKEAIFLRVDKDLDQDIKAFVKYLNAEKKKNPDDRDLKVADVFEIAMQKYMIESGYTDVREKYNPEGYRKSLEPIDHGKSEKN